MRVVTADDFAAIYRDNLVRQHEFLRGVVLRGIERGWMLLSHDLVGRLHYHATYRLQRDGGYYRSGEVRVGKNGSRLLISYVPPPPERVERLMIGFLSQTLQKWDRCDAVPLAAFVLWSINWIHPFEDGNGRTARAAAYFVLCAKARRWFPGEPALPALLVREYPRYLHGIERATWTGGRDLSELEALIAELMAEQLASAEPRRLAHADQLPPAL